MVFGLGGKEGKIPIDKVRELSAEGKSEREIVEQLRDEGYGDRNINKALNQALKFKVEGEEPRQGGGRGPGQPQFVAPPPQGNMPKFPSGYESRGGGSSMGPETIEMTEEEEISLEEIVEEIISEKWREVEGRLEEFSTRIGETSARLEDLKERINRVEGKHEEEKVDLRNKLEETSTHIEGIESRMNSMERAFKEFLPTLTENVRSLSEIVKELKGQSSKFEERSQRRQNPIRSSPSFSSGGKGNETSGMKGKPSSFLQKSNRNQPRSDRSKGLEPKPKDLKKELRKNKEKEPSSLE